MVRVTKIGLIGEAPSDTQAIRNLLSKKYALNFIPLLNNQRGDNLETAKTQRMLQIEIQSKQPDLLLFIRDLDALASNKNQEVKRRAWFNKLKASFGGESLLLLNIYELEALILSDIASFNKIYKTSFNFKGDPMAQREPKELLMHQTQKSGRKFRESDNPEIFQELHIEEVQKKCRYFRDFIRELDKVLAA